VNRRGRAHAEVPGIFHRVISRLEPQKECMIIHDKMEAIQKAIAQMEEDEMILAFYDEKDKLTRVLTECNATAVETIEWPAARISNPVPLAETTPGLLHLAMDFHKKRRVLNPPLLKI
jgi:hypothetical protein